MKKILSIFIACMMTITMVACNKESTDNSKNQSSNLDATSSEQDTTTPLPKLESNGLYSGSLVNTMWFLISWDDIYEFSFTENSMGVIKYSYTYNSNKDEYFPNVITTSTESIPCTITDNTILFDSNIIDSYYTDDWQLYKFLDESLNLSYFGSTNQYGLYYKILDNMAFFFHDSSSIPQSDKLQDFLDVFPSIGSASMLSNQTGFVTQYKHSEYSNEQLLEFLDGAWTGVNIEDFDETQDFESQCSDAFEINSKEKSLSNSYDRELWETIYTRELTEYITGDITGAVGYIRQRVNGSRSPSFILVDVIDEQTIYVTNYCGYDGVFIFKRTDSMPEQLADNSQE